jgi:hypothetical protein
MPQISVTRITVHHHSTPRTGHRPSERVGGKQLLLLRAQRTVRVCGIARRPLEGWANSAAALACWRPKLWMRMIGQCRQNAENFAWCELSAGHLRFKP